jgi:hypothetical protein
MTCQRYREYDILPCLESQKRVKCTSFVQHVSMIFLVLVVERVTVSQYDRKLRCKIAQVSLFLHKLLVSYDNSYPADENT